MRFPYLDHSPHTPNALWKILTVPARRVCRFRRNSPFLCLHLTALQHFFKRMKGIPFWVWKNMWKYSFDAELNEISYGFFLQFRIHRFRFYRASKWVTKEFNAGVYRRKTLAKNAPTRKTGQKPLLKAKTPTKQTKQTITCSVISKLIFCAYAY